VAKTLRIRGSWFIQAGLGIGLLSALPFASVLLVRLTTHENIEVGPTFLWLMLGAGFGCVAIVLGFVGLLIRKVAKDGDPK
jgi:hypothetical protein